MGRVQRVRNGLASFRQTIIWRLLMRQKSWIVWLVVTGSMSTGGAVGMARTIRDLVDEGVVERINPVEDYIGALVFLAFWTLCWGIALRQVIARIGYHLEFELRIWLYERLQSTDPQRLDSLATGQMVTRAMTDLLLLELLIVILPAILVVGIVLLGIALLMIAIHPLLSIVAFSALPINSWLIIRIRRRLWGMSWVMLDRRARVTTVIDESVRGARVVKSFGREDHERARLAETARTAFGAGMTRVRLVAKYDLLLNAVPSLATAALVFFGVNEGISGRLTVGDLFLFFQFSLVFTGLARLLGQIQSAWQFAKTGAGRIFELIAYAKPAVVATGAPLPGTGDGLRLDGVSVVIKGHPVIADLDLTAGPGELVVVAGPPRSGKTTLSRVIAGGQPTAGGSATIDGVPIDGADPISLRRAVRVVTEEPFLFGRSVRENLALGCSADITDAELWAALDAAGAREVVDELPGGLDALLGDRGLTVSGGQRQRLALACALVVPPRVLVLDDALSAVDPALEITILGQIRQHAPETAIVAVTRRPGAQALADRVVTLPPPADGAPRRPRAQGSLAVDGPYDLLLAGIVAKLPEDRDEPVASDADATRDEVPTVRGILSPHWVHVAPAAALLLVFTVFGLVPTWMIQVGLDGVGDGDRGAAVLAGLVTVIAAAAVAVSSYGYRIEAKKVEEGVGYLLRRRAFARLMRLGVDFYDRELPGRIAARVVHDLDQISIFLETGVYELATSVCLLLASFAVIALWDPSVALSVALVVPVLAVLTVAQLRPAERAYDKARAALGDVVERLQEDFAGRYVIEAAGAEESSRSEFVRLAFELRQARRRATTIANVYIELMQFVASLAGASLLATAANRVFDGALSVGGMVALELFLVAALAPIPALSGVLQRYLAARASFRTLGEPFVAPVRPAPTDGAPPCDSAAGDIELSGVSFAYPETGRRVLHDVDLHVRSGTTIAVVGPTGAGKSSIAKLIARVYDPDEGVVRIGGHDIRGWDLESYRRRIGIVPQDGFCFRGTVAENIAYGRPGATGEQIAAAAEAVGALDAVLGLQGGLDARVEEEGRNLTAAQIQLIALARCWLTEPDLLILDEATSSLDPESERHVLDATRAMPQTTIMVTHRLPVAQAADTVVVVDRGTIVESGKPADLRRRKNSAYRALWEAGPEVEARIAGAGGPAEVVAPVRAANGRADHKLVVRAIDDLRSGALGVRDFVGADVQSPNGAGAEAAMAGLVIGETDEELAEFLAGAGGVATVAGGFLEAMRSGVDPAVAGDVSVAFEISEDEHTHRWILRSTTTGDVATLMTGPDPAQLTMGMSGVDLLRLSIGSLDPIEAVMAGRITISGDLELMTRLGTLFNAGAAVPMG